METVMSLARERSMTSKKQFIAWLEIYSMARSLEGGYAAIISQGTTIWV